MNGKEFRAELVKIMPGYKWTVHKPYIPDKDRLEATGIQTSGFNRLSTLSVVRIEKEGEQPSYSAKSAGYGRSAPWLYENNGESLAQALRGLQNRYESTANTYAAHAAALQQGRQDHSASAGKAIREAA